jgi:Spy/CpxP family protein refolding chaperone
MMVQAKRARLAGLFMLAIMFAVGALAGAATMRVVSADEPPVLRQAREQPDLLDRLELTAEQRARADAILERRRAEMEAFWDEHRPALRAIADSARTELRALLTPEQQELEARFMAERREHQEKRAKMRTNRW